MSREGRAQRGLGWRWDGANVVEDDGSTVAPWAPLGWWPGRTAHAGSVLWGPSWTAGLRAGHHRPPLPQGWLVYEMKSMFNQSGS